RLRVRARDAGPALPVEPVDRVDEAARLHPLRPVDPQRSVFPLLPDEAGPVLLVVSDVLPLPDDVLEPAVGKEQPIELAGVPVQGAGAGDSPPARGHDVVALQLLVGGEELPDVPPHDVDVAGPPEVDPPPA